MSKFTKGRRAGWPEDLTPHGLISLDLRVASLSLNEFLSRMKILCAALATIGLACALRAETELISNDKLSDDGAAWTLKTSPGAAASVSVVDDGGERSLCVEVQPAGDESAAAAQDIRIQRLFGEIATGKHYQISFKAKSSEAAKIIPFVYPENQGARVLWRTEVKTDPEWKDFSFTFAGKDTASDCVLGFSHLGRVAGKYYFKDIVLKED